MTDLLALTAELVDIPSVSRHEGPLVDHLERQLTAVPSLTVDRVGENLVARTAFGRTSRLILGGHTDTVPPARNEHARIDGDTLWGVGSADMKGSLAVMLELARTIDEGVASVDATYVFYAREEVAAAESGLQELFDTRPDLLEGDAAILGEPTGSDVEAGCQGTMRLCVSVRGERAHTARAWMGSNAIHRLTDVLATLDRYEGRRPVIDACEFREALQAVHVKGGVAGNVVPDYAELIVNHRFAPDRTPAEAESHVREILSPALGPEDEIELIELATPAPPGLRHPLLAALVERNGLEVRAKLGWTDVSWFAERGIPATNFGPGESTLAHTADERIDRAALDRALAVLGDLLTHGV